MFGYALRYFSEAGHQWLDLGGAPGLGDDSSGGLSRFKRGWATGTRVAYLCGRIFDRAMYASLVATASDADTSYFPAYRDGELFRSSPSLRRAEP
jgi:hypothetical protein